MEEKLKQAISQIEMAATNLSEVLSQFDLSNIPFCERDLNTVDVGMKIKVAKFLLSVVRASA